MKKILITVSALALLAVGGLFAIAQLAPIERIKQEAVAQVKDKTGRDLDFSAAQLAFWPNIGVKMKDVTFSNADWSAEKNMMTLSELDVQLALLPLLQREVQVKRFVLVRPVINLEKSADGKANWDFNRGAKADTAADSAGQGGGAGYGVQLGVFEIRDGQLNYTDRQSGQSQLLEDVDMRIDYPDMDSAAKLEGAFDYKGQRVTLGLDIDKPLDMGGGKPSAGSLSLRSDAINAAIQGVFATSGKMLKGGTIEADISSLPELAAWLGGGAKTEMPFTRVSFRAKAEGGAEAVSLDDAALSLDDVSAKGDVTLSLSGVRPAITARLGLGKLSLDRFIGGADGKGTGAGSAKGGDGWDTAPIDFSALKALDADVVLDTEGFSLKGIDVGASRLTARLKDGNLQASSSKASLLGGSFSSDVAVMAAGGLAIKFDMTGVEAQPVLAAFADFKKLTGKVDAHIDVSGQGKSQRDIMGSLAGSGSAVFRNGALTGIDLVKIAKTVQGGLSNFGIGEGKTDFVELGGTFKIAGGVAHNEDLKMKGPLLQATGSGDVNIGAQTVKYRVIPVLTASSAVENAKGIAVPVDISGPFSKLSIRPDLQGAIQGVLDNPEAVKDTLKNAKAQGKALETNLKDLKKDPKQAIGNLLGGGGLFGKKAAAPAESAPAVQTAPATAPAVTPAAEPAPVAAPAAPAAAETSLAPAEAVPVEMSPAEETPAAQISAPSAP